MSVESASAFNWYLSEQARLSVVRMTDPESLDGDVFTGFFVSPVGHLLTAFHAIKPHFLDLPDEFPLTIELDAANTGSDLSGTTGAPDATTVVARGQPDWCDPRADWAILWLRYDPPAYLPVATGRVLDLCSDVRVYGFTVTHSGPASLGAFTGQFLRSTPERRRFHVAFSVRSRGQSGGPVIDMRTRTVVGSVVGYREDEHLTADVAVIDQQRLAEACAGVDLADLAHRWRTEAADAVCRSVPELGVITADTFLPDLPAQHLADRPARRTLVDPILAGERSSVCLHGPPGSGKTVLALEAALAFTRSQPGRAIFWHDFAPRENRAEDDVLKRLALHLLRADGAIEAIEACLDDQFARDKTAATTATISALTRGRHVLVLDNVHFLQRDGHHGTLELLGRVLRAARQGESIVLLTSWDLPRPPIDTAVHPTVGFTAPEVSAFLAMHGVRLSARGHEWISALAEDITCVEQFVRSPDWRSAVEAGRPQSTEPTEMLRYWLNRYLVAAPPGGHRVLLALAILAEPSAQDLVEAVAEIDEFAHTLAALETSPPLVRRDQNLLYVHLNVARAVRATADRAAVRDMHRSAGRLLAERREPIRAANHLLEADSDSDALALLYARRDEIIGQGEAEELARLVERIVTRDRVDPARSHQVHAVLASCETIRGEYERAVRRWRWALHADLDGLEAAVLHNRHGDTCRLASDYDGARTEYLAASRLAGALDSAPAAMQLGRAQLGLAKLDRLRADYPSALRRYEDARTAFELVFDDHGILEADFGVGEVSRLIEDWQTAASRYEASLHRAVARDDIEREAYGLWGVGEVQRLTGKLADAAGSHERGLELCLRVGDVRSEGWALMGLAETYRATGHEDDGRTAYRAALDRFRRTKSGTEAAHAQLGIAETSRALGEVDLTGYAEALRVYEAKKLGHCCVVCLRCTAQALRDSGQDRAAARMFKRARRLAGTLGLSAEVSRVDRMLGGADYPRFVPLNFP